MKVKKEKREKNYLKVRRKKLLRREELIDRISRLEKNRLRRVDKKERKRKDVNRGQWRKCKH